MTVALKTLPETVSAQTFLEIKQDAANLEKQNLPESARLLATRIRTRIEEVQQILGLSVFSPEKAGKVVVAELQNTDGGAWSGAELKDKFNLTPAFLHRRRKEHRIVYWRNAKDDYFYPRWQFTPSGALLPGVQDVLQIFASRDEWRVMRYFLGLRKQLGDRRPLDLLRSGEVDKVIAHARAHAAENTW